MRGSTVSPIVCTLLLTLSVASSALADTALFRVEQRWATYPFPAVTSGGAGMDQGYIQPSTMRTMKGEYLYPPPTAIVEPGNPIGGAFTLPQSFLTFSTVKTLTPKTRWPGYTTTYYYIGYNGPGKFQPNFGSTASQLRLVFPTTGGNPPPNYGFGNPVTPTTTFGGRYDMSREGSIRVTPGPRRFGGTFRLFFYPEAGWKQYIFQFSPALYQGYGYYVCLDDGMYDCTPDTFVSEPGTTAIYLGVRWLLTEKGRAKATTPTRLGGTTPTPYGNASYLRRNRHYLNLIHPWTTGYAWVHKPQPGTAGVYFPNSSGYDTSLGGVDITVTHHDWNQLFNEKLLTITTSTQTTKQYLKGVTRVVSMVRPRLIHTYEVPLDPIENIWTGQRLWRLKVFFLPEPAGMLLLGTGLGCLVVLHRLCRRD